MRGILETVAEGMKSLAINYEFGRWSGEPDYPYFVGEYVQTEPTAEDGEQDCAFTLTGFTRGTWDDLEKCREKICTLFDPFDGYRASKEGAAIVAFYDSATPVPTDTDELRRIQIDLTIKKWRA